MLQLAPGDRIEIDARPDALAPRVAVAVRVLRADGRVEAFQARAAVETGFEVELLRAGGVIPSILRRTLDNPAPCPATCLPPSPPASSN